MLSVQLGSCSPNSSYSSNEYTFLDQIFGRPLLHLCAGAQIFGCSGYPSSPQVYTIRLSLQRLLLWAFGLMKLLCGEEKLYVFRSKTAAPNVQDRRKGIERLRMHKYFHSCDIFKGGRRGAIKLKALDFEAVQGGNIHSPSFQEFRPLAVSR
ncbi:hypothetical protein TWF106_002457 [Orbilia oligospora]|uniref:Uncharacterized protein n=1 Tax=Orbilia oligospora TaxID=2813651 RepID=A0A6G1MK13_ORBOL|nr:hypothetical protein TWF788_002217 [Orbilia oligospora]KAF3202246.1 hypothetical protein TWF106_002457 [Orbilia oligospora]KAF3205169.1 hypothetical protein TWF679_009394 [Orbilia oligospora]KAF3223254.1 hypothetical protein TWF191_006535 [Orbilia oligospora]KAF3259603.1 hypothetical protein TWF192_010462 [Orbilia oligospora]